MFVSLAGPGPVVAAQRALGDRVPGKAPRRRKRLDGVSVRSRKRSLREVGTRGSSRRFALALRGNVDVHGILRVVFFRVFSCLVFVVALLRAPVGERLLPRRHRREHRRLPRLREARALSFRIRRRNLPFDFFRRRRRRLRHRRVVVVRLFAGFFVRGSRSHRRGFECFGFFVSLGETRDVSQVAREEIGALRHQHGRVRVLLAPTRARGGSRVREQVETFDDVRDLFLLFCPFLFHGIVAEARRLEQRGEVRLE